MPEGLRISREEYCEAVHGLEKETRRIDRFNEGMRNVFSDGDWDPPMLTEIDSFSALILLLSRLTEDRRESSVDESWLEYFIFELDYGKKWSKGSVVDENGEDIPFSTPEEVYDFLSGEHEKKKEKSE